MKGLIVLLCALVAVQARSTAVSKSSVREVAALGENPWVVHLRIAVSTSGLLDTCAGSLIDNSWVLTAASCIDTVRFIWIRYGTVDVINPELVTENSIVRYQPGAGANPDSNIALISINRFVEYTDYISPVALATRDTETPDSAKLCSYGANDEGGPGETLSCAEVELEYDRKLLVADVESSVFDLGAPLVKDGVQIGVLAGVAGGESLFVRPGEFLQWIEDETGLDFGSVEAVVADTDGTKVNFVN